MDNFGEALVDWIFTMRNDVGTAGLPSRRIVDISGLLPETPVCPHFAGHGLTYLLTGCAQPASVACYLGKFA